MCFKMRLQSYIVNYWHGMNNMLFLTILGDFCGMQKSKEKGF